MCCSAERSATSGGRRLSRREALASSGALLAACGRRAPAKASHVSIVRAPAYDGTIYGAVRQVFSAHKLDLRGRKVLLKPNLVEFDPGSVINTHPVVVHAVLEACRAAGAAAVHIAEGPGHRRLTLDLADAAAYFSTIEGFEDLFADLNLDEVQSVRFSRPFSKLESLYLPKTALAADLIISLPKMKTHHWVGATLSMKNLFGVVPGAVYGWPKNVLHWAGIDECIADLYSVFPKHFALVDGIQAMEGNGPIQGTSRHVGVLVAGTDFHAVDATCCRIMGINPDGIRYLQLVGSRQAFDQNVVQIGESIRTVQTPFRLIPEFERIRLPIGERS